jgi:hypothetical protein
VALETNVIPSVINSTKALGKMDESIPVDAAVI